MTRTRVHQDTRAAPLGRGRHQSTTTQTGEHNAIAPLHQSPMPVPAVCTRPFSGFEKKTTKRQDKTKQIHSKKKEKKVRGGRRRDTTTNSTRKPHTARTPVDRRHVGKETAHAHAPRAAKGQEATVYTPRVGRTEPTGMISGASGRSSTARPLVRARPGCIQDHGKRRPEPSKGLMTCVPAQSSGGGCLHSSEAPQLEPQG